MVEPDPGLHDAARASEETRLTPLMGAAASEMISQLPKRGADAVQRLVDIVHDKGVRPAVLATRAIVFGLLVAVLALLALVLVSIAVLRLFDVYVFGTSVYLSYVVLGGALTLLGFALWTRRTKRSAGASPG